MSNLAIIPRKQVAPKTQESTLVALVRELDEMRRVIDFACEVGSGLVGTDLHNRHEVEPVRVLVRDIGEYVAGPDYADTTEKIAKATEYARDTFIAEQIALLRMAWPIKGEPGEVAARTAMLTVEIKSMAVSRYALAAGFRKLRLESKFVPSICEAIQAIQAAEWDVQRARTRHAELPGRLEAEKRHLAEHDQIQAHNAWAGSVKAEANYICHRCGDGAQPRWMYRVVWKLNDKSDAVCACRYCSTRIEGKGDHGR